MSDFAWTVNPLLALQDQLAEESTPEGILLTLGEWIWRQLEDATVSVLRPDRHSGTARIIRIFSSAPADHDVVMTFGFDPRLVDFPIEMSDERLQAVHRGECRLIQDGLRVLMGGRLSKAAAASAARYIGTHDVYGVGVNDDGRYEGAIFITSPNGLGAIESLIPLAARECALLLGRMRLTAEVDAMMLDVERMVERRTRELSSANALLGLAVEQAYANALGSQLSDAAPAALFRLATKRPSTVHELLDLALEEMLGISGSLYGYIYYYFPDRKEFVSHAWSKGVMEDCSVLQVPVIYQLDKTGIWGEVVRQSKPLIVNDFRRENPLKKGYPEGHVEVDRWMSVPVIVDGHIVAVAGVGNKVEPYTDEDVAELQALMQAVWSLAERTRLEEQSRSRKERLREVTAQLATVEQRERRRMSVDLHDRVMQPLAAAKINLDLAATEGDGQMRAHELARATDLLDSAIRESRALTEELSPTLLYEVGLDAAIGWLVDRVRERGVTCDLTVEGAFGTIDEPTALLGYHAARELIEGAVSGHHCSRIGVSIAISPWTLTLFVDDDCCGFDVSTIHEGDGTIRGLRLLGVTERVVHAGGEVEISSSADCGTAVFVTLPIGAAKQ